jgi:hypothetical protein
VEIVRLYKTWPLTKLPHFDRSPIQFRLDVLLHIPSTSQVYRLDGWITCQQIGIAVTEASCCYVLLFEESFYGIDNTIRSIRPDEMTASIGWYFVKVIRQFSEI